MVTIRIYAIVLLAMLSMHGVEAHKRKKGVIVSLLLVIEIV